MIIKLGEYEYNETHTVISQLRSMASLIGEDATEQLEAIVSEEHAHLVVHRLYPFTNTLKEFETALDSLSDGRVIYYESNTLDELRTEATNWFGDDRWHRIEDIIELYTFTLNNKTHFAEILV